MSSERHSEAATVKASSTAGEELSRDLALVSAILRKDRKATAELVSLHADRVYAYVKRRLAPRGDLADDLVQDVFLAALRHLPSYQGTSPLRSWLLGIARHKIETYYRDRLRAPTLIHGGYEEPAAAGPPLDELIHREQIEAKTQRLLRLLPEPYSLVLLWRYWENRSVREIAHATGRTEKAVERLLSRARARFRELWEA